MIDQPEPHPERMRLELLESMAAKRLARANDKLATAQAELAAAAAGHAAAVDRLAAWDAANPDPQLALI